MFIFEYCTGMYSIERYTSPPLQLPVGPAPSFSQNWRPTLKKRRVTIPPRPSHRLNLWTIMKNCIGKDLSKIPMPVSDEQSSKRKVLRFFRLFALSPFIFIVFCMYLCKMVELFQLKHTITLWSHDGHLWNVFSPTSTISNMQ